MPYVTEDNLTDVALERWKDIPDSRLASDPKNRGTNNMFCFGINRDFDKTLRLTFSTARPTRLIGSFAARVWMR